MNRKVLGRLNKAEKRTLNPISLPQNLINDIYQFRFELGAGWINIGNQYLASKRIAEYSSRNFNNALKAEYVIFVSISTYDYSRIGSSKFMAQKQIDTIINNHLISNYSTTGIWSLKDLIKRNFTDNQLSYELVGEKNYDLLGNNDFTGQVVNQDYISSPIGD